MTSSTKRSPLRRRSRAGSRRVNALLVLASVGLSLLLTEAVLRLAGRDHPQFYMLDPLVGWRPRPTIAGWHLGEVDNYIAINQEGYRDVDHALAKPAGVYRILILGDSMSEGVEVALDHLYWKQLESLLPRCPGFAGRQIEVISLAVNGYGTAQEYLTLKERGLKYQPDLVLLAFFTGNDLTDNSKALGQHRDRPYFTLRDGRLVLEQTAGDAPDFLARRHWEELKHRFLDSIRIIQLARQAQAQLRLLLRFGHADPTRIEQPGLDSRVFLPPTIAEWQESWSVTEGLIGAIADSARAGGAAFAMTTLTNPLQVVPDIAARDGLAKQLGVVDLTYPDRRLAQFAAARGFADIALVEPLAAYAATHHAALHGIDSHHPIGHWNILGHRRAAKELSRRLCEEMAPGSKGQSSHYSFWKTAQVIRYSAPSQ